MGCEAEGPHDPNKGGTVDLDGFKVTLMHAQHSSSYMTEAPPALRAVGDRLHGRAVRPRLRLRGRREALLRRRHERLRRHGADRAALRAGHRDPADRRPLHDGSEGGGRRARAAWTSSAASRATTAPSRSSPARPSSCASWLPASRSSRRSRESRSSCEGALVRRDRPARPRARARGLARRSRARSSLDDVGDAARLREAHAQGHAGRRAGGDAGGGEGGARAARGGVACSCPRRSCSRSTSPS